MLLKIFLFIKKKYSGFFFIKIVYKIIFLMDLHINNFFRILIKNILFIVHKNILKFLFIRKYC